MKESLNNKYTIKDYEVCPFCLNRTKGFTKIFMSSYSGGHIWILKCKKGHEWNVHKLRKQQTIHNNYCTYISNNLNSKISKKY